MRITQPGIREELLKSTGPGVVEDAVQIFIAREQVALNSYLPDDACARLRGELFGAMHNGTEYAVEVIQRYHALVTLLKANAQHSREIEASRWASTATIVGLQSAVEMASGYGWDVSWSKFNTRIERIQ